MASNARKKVNAAMRERLKAARQMREPREQGSPLGTATMNLINDDIDFENFHESVRRREQAKQPADDMILAMMGYGLRRIYPTP